MIHIHPGRSNWQPQSITAITTWSAPPSLPGWPIIPIAPGPAGPAQPLVAGTSGCFLCMIPPVAKPNSKQQCQQCIAIPCSFREPFLGLISFEYKKQPGSTLVDLEIPSIWAFGRPKTGTSRHRRHRSRWDLRTPWHTWDMGMSP